MPLAPQDLPARWFELVWNQGRREAIDEMFAAEGIAHGLGEAGRDAVGPQAFYGFWQLMRDAFEGMRFVVDEVIVDGERVAARWTASLTHTGPFLGVPPTGRTVSVTGMVFVRVRDGQIQEAWNNWDLMGLMQQVGGVAETKLLGE